MSPGNCWTGSKDAIFFFCVYLFNRVRSRLLGYLDSSWYLVGIPDLSLFFCCFFFFVKRMSHLLFSRCIYALTPADRVVLRSSLMIITVPSLFPVFVCRKLYILGERRITCKAITFLMHFAFCSLTQAYSMCVYVMWTCGDGQCAYSEAASADGDIFVSCFREVVHGKGSCWCCSYSH